MPYIAPDKRPSLDQMIDCLAPRIGSVGELNYTITKLTLKYLGKPSYAKLAGIVGTLVCVVLELYWRVGRPYEDLKCKENGDVF